MSNNIIFTYNEESAISSCHGGYINETGAYVITITEAKLTRSDGGAEFIEFSGESDDGKKVNYLNICYKKNDGTINTFGNNMIHAIMGCCGIRQSSVVYQGSNAFSPEFKNKKVGLVLQKILKTKKAGEDTYSLDIKMPFYPNTWQTILEKVENKEAVAVKKYLSTLKDKDERKQVNSNNNQPPFWGEQRRQQHQNQNNTPQSDFDDDIPF